MKYRVSHQTIYSYDDDVRNSLGFAHVTPRVLPWQHVASHEVNIDPGASQQRQHIDTYGNTATYFHVTAPHRTLTIAASTSVSVEPPQYAAESLAAPWEDSRPLVSPSTPGAWQAADFAMASPKVQQVAAASDYAAESLMPGRPIGEAVTDLMHRIYTDFDYDSTATTVTSTVPDVLEKRAGVCQDFAHLAIACLRSHRVAARYVSGYLATQPPPGKERIVGADASHAWLSVWLPGSDQWLAIDPTNDQWIADRHVTVAWGRDYADVTPVKGVIFTQAKKSKLRVSVDVSPREAHMAS
ncbi:transglutaminase-like putative cysteine protease [Microbacterium halimionae]|uniref:Transglutaminase-like putative cysteine protease n=1 Tax=Microbacterium halimionae TaxID=1526413 RepID=A0A7W3PKS0_9MICO|nr:transglutaminase family protein [Microbacterium halimionae]MBA8815261.1 transglutaminase-like putative cysteine protease [Microbacterium halimionae]NII93948.1 transglutaminase-like putative cysteine protease [Microbacterium halimionae]